MSRIAYVNGRYVRNHEAAVNIQDRGYQFADGVYEVCLVIDGAFWDAKGHLARLQRSLSALQIRSPMNDGAINAVIRQLLARNRMNDALVYIQVTRGAAPRNHPFPGEDVDPAIVMTVRPFDLDQSDRQAANGIGVITTQDIRWARVDIKSVSLLPNVLAKQEAVERDAGEAWLVRDGKVTEGSSSNAWIVDDSGALITHPKTSEILGGITRETALKCAADLQMQIHERPFSVEEAKAAKEAFITSATGLVMPVVRIDDDAIADGAPGAASLRLREAYKERARQNQ